jgi:chemotaxis protein MotA
LSAAIFRRLRYLKSTVYGWTLTCTERSGAIILASSETALAQQLRVETALEGSARRRHFDVLFLIGVVVALSATIIGIRSTGVSIRYFLQPAGAVIVLGGTLGVILITTPRYSLIHSMRRVMDLISATDVNREALLEEIVYCAREARRGGILSVETLLPQIRHPFLADALLLAIDIANREELRTVLETELRMKERQGEADAKALEVAGGYAPTLGIIGTVVGLIDVLRQFSNLQSVGTGIGTAFVSTIYGLALANLLLLPAAHRIRARVAENFEIQELVLEGVLSIVDSVHPSLIRMRLDTFVRKPKERAS